MFWRRLRSGRDRPSPVPTRAGPGTLPASRQVAERSPGAARIDGRICVHQGVEVNVESAAAGASPSARLLPKGLRQPPAVTLPVRRDSRPVWHRNQPAPGRSAQPSGPFASDHDHDRKWTEIMTVDDCRCMGHTGMAARRRSPRNHRCRRYTRRLWNGDHERAVTHTIKKYNQPNLT